MSSFLNPSHLRWQNPSGLQLCESTDVCSKHGSGSLWKLQVVCAGHHGWHEIICPGSDSDPRLKEIVRLFRRISGIPITLQRNTPHQWHQCSISPLEDQVFPSHQQLASAASVVLVELPDGCRMDMIQCRMPLQGCSKLTPTGFNLSTSCRLLVHLVQLLTLSSHLKSSHGISSLHRIGPFLPPSRVVWALQSRLKAVLEHLRMWLENSSFSKLRMTWLPQLKITTAWQPQRLTDLQLQYGYDSTWGHQKGTNSVMFDIPTINFELSSIILSHSSKAKRLSFERFQSFHHWAPKPVANIRKFRLTKPRGNNDIETLAKCRGKTLKFLWDKYIRIKWAMETKPFVTLY